MQIKFGQNLIDFIRFKNCKICNLKSIIQSYLYYKKALKEIKKIPKYKIIFKFDDLINYNKNVKKLDEYVKNEKLKVCWGIIGNSLEKPDKNYIQFIRENNLKNYHFFNHGYLHLCAPEYEFFDKPQNVQEDFIKKTQDIVLDKIGINLNSFGAPCNHIDENTKLALENVSDIKYWFFGLEDFKGVNIKRLVDMENGAGNPDFIFFLDNLKNLKTDYNILTIQGHPYMWNKLQKFNFRLIVKFLKKINCEFIFPEDIDYMGEDND